MLNEDYKEMLQSLLGHDVKFLVVGAYAMGAQGYPRATGDIDIWVEASPDNSKKTFAALVEYGAALHDLNEDDFTEPGMIFQVGVAPRRIDIITSIDGVDFSEAYRNRYQSEFGGMKTPILALPDLIKNKESTGRAKDKLDAKRLRGMQNGG